MPILLDHLWFLWLSSWPRRLLLNIYFLLILLYGHQTFTVASLMDVKCPISDLRRKGVRILSSILSNPCLAILTAQGTSHLQLALAKYTPVKELTNLLTSAVFQDCIIDDVRSIDEAWAFINIYTGRIWPPKSCSVSLCNSAGMTKSLDKLTGLLGCFIHLKSENNNKYLNQKKVYKVYSTLL